MMRARRESGTEGSEGLRLGTWPVEHLGDERKQHLGVKIQAGGSEIATLHRGDLLIVDTERLCDADVLDPLVLGTSACRDEQDRELAQPRIELQLCEQNAGEAQVGDHRRVRVREHLEDIQRRKRVQRLHHAWR
jgi:hypothetical protein